MSALKNALGGMGLLIKFIEAWFTRAKEGFSQIHLLHRRPVLLILRVIQEMRSDDATHLAAGISYFAIFSLFPILLGSLAILGMILISVDTQETFVSFLIENLPGSEEFISAVVPVVRHDVESLARFSGLFGIIALV